MKSFMTYESNVLFALRFMIDCNVVGGNWIEVPVGKYKKTVRSSSYCQLEFDCLYPLVPEVFVSVSVALTFLIEIPLLDRPYNLNNYPLTHIIDIQT